MASAPELVATIRAMPWRNGLLTAGQQATIDETALWKAVNTGVDLDGTMSKRPGLKRWGQTIKQADPAATGSTATYFEPWLAAGWVVTDSSAGLASPTTGEGRMRMAIDASAGTESYTLDKTIGAAPAGSKWSMRLSLRAIGVPAYAGGTSAKTLAIRGAAAAASAKEFAIFEQGLYYKRASDDTYVLIADTAAAADGGFHTIEFRVDDAAGNTTVYLDEELVLTVTSATLKDVTLAANTIMSFRWQVFGDGTTAYSTELGPAMYNDVVADPFVAQTILGITDFRFINTAGAQRRALMMAAGDYVYHDNGQIGIWRPLQALQHDSVFFAPFRRTMIWADFSQNVTANLWQWDGVDPPMALTDAPPVRFVTEHKQRLWAAGDRSNPLRVYFSGDRQPNLWFSPSPENIEDQEDAVFQAGYLEVPAKKGDEVVALFGDYYGAILIFTRRGVWRVEGNGPASFVLTSVNQDVGCENADCVTQVGNDLWFLGRQGVHSLAATDQFGDLQMQYLSAPISDLWGQTPRGEKKIIRDFLTIARLKYNPALGLVYAAVPLTGSAIPDTVFVYSVNTKQWYGPWEIDSQALENIEIAPPEIEVMAHGGSDGQVLYTETASRFDVDAGYSLLIESAFLTGRSADPEYVARKKTWRRMRLFYLPRGAWNVTISWYDENGFVNSETFDQNVHKWFVLDEDMRLDLDPDGEIGTPERLAYRDINLSAHSFQLRFKIEQTGAGQDLVIQGYEIDFSPGKKESL